MKSELKTALQQTLGYPVTSEELDAAADNLVSFFALLVETDRRARLPILSNTIYGWLSPDDVEYMFT